MSLSDLRYLRALGEQRSSDAGTDAQPMDSEPQLVTELRSKLEAVQQAWSEEKQHLQSSVESLKKLLTQIQVDLVLFVDFTTRRKAYPFGMHPFTGYPMKSIPQSLLLRCCLKALTIILLLFLSKKCIFIIKCNVWPSVL